MTDLVKVYLTAVDNTGGAFGKLQRSLGLTELRVESLRGKLLGLGKSFVGGLAGGLVLGALTDPFEKAKEAVKEFGDKLDEIKRTGLSSNLFQALSFGALETGTNQETLNKSLENFLLRVGEARHGYGELYSGLKDTNRQLLSNILAARDQDGALRALSEGVRSATSAEQAAVIQNAALGKGFAQTTELLKGGTQGLSDFEARAQSMGYTIDRSLLEKADQIGDKYNVATTIIDIQFKSALVNLAPVLVTTSGWLVEVSKVTNQLSSDVANATGKFNEFTTMLKGLAGQVGPEEKSALEAFFSIAATAAQKAATSILPFVNSMLAVRDIYNSLHPAAAAHANPSHGGDLTMAAAGGLPTGSGIPTSQSDALSSAKKIADTIKDLNIERAALSLSSREQAIWNAQKQAGLDPTKQWNAAIAASAGALYDAQQAQEALTQGAQFFGQNFADAFSAIVIRGEDANQVLLKLLETMAEAVVQAIIMQAIFTALGLPTAGVGGPLGGLIGGLFHEGGMVGAGGGAGRSLPSFMFAAAPRLHNGLAADEFPAILQRGEEVIPRGGRGQGMSMVIHIHEPMDSQGIARFFDRNGEHIAKSLSKQARNFHPSLARGR